MAQRCAGDFLSGAFVRPLGAAIHLPNPRAAIRERAVDEDTDQDGLAPSERSEDQVLSEARAALLDAREALLGEREQAADWRDGAADEREQAADKRRDAAEREKRRFDGCVQG